MFRKLSFRLVVILLGLWLIFDLVSRLGAEIFWFAEVGYLQVFLLRIKTQALLWAIAFSITAFYLLGNLSLAQRLTRGEVQRAANRVQGNLQSKTPLATPSSSLGLRFFLPLVLGLNLLVGLLVLHYGQVALQYWHPNLNGANVSPPIPALFRPESILTLARQVRSQAGLVGLLL